MPTAPGASPPPNVGLSPGHGPEPAGNLRRSASDLCVHAVEVELGAGQWVRSKGTRRRVWAAGGGVELGQGQAAVSRTALHFTSTAWALKSSSICTWSGCGREAAVCG